MRVAMVTPHYENIRGGGEISVRLLVEQLRKQNHEVDVFSDLSMGLMKVKLKNVRDDYDVFHCYNMKYLPVVGWLSKKYGVRSVGTLNGIVFSRSMSGKKNYRTFWKEYFLKDIKHITGFSTLCPFYKQSWVNDGLPSDKIRVVTNMYDPGFVSEHHIYSDKVRLLFVGGKCWWRNLGLFKQLSKDFESRVIGIGWGERVSYEYMPGVYAGSDLLVLPYRIPVPVSRCIIEAMQSGIPVITSGVDVFSPIIENNVSGVLVDSEFVGDWVDSINSLVSNKDFYDKVSVNAKDRVEQVCNPVVVVNQYVDMYRELLNC